MARPVGILVRSDPYRQRAGRERLDLAMIAAALDLPVRVFFVGDGLLHLAANQSPAALPAAPYTRGWLALLELGSAVSLFAQQSGMQNLQSEEFPVTVLDEDRLAASIQECRMVLHV